MLGHSDPSLTANVYMDVNALSLGSEIEKLPWVGGDGDDAQGNAQKCVRQCVRKGFGEIVGDLITFVQNAVTEWKTDFPSVFGMAARAGIEPATK